MLLETYQKPKQLISMTPLIDVVFILLLFFMLSSTFNRTKQMEINASSTGSSAQEGLVVRVLIQASGSVSINGFDYPWGSADLTEQLKKYAASGDKVYLAATSETRVQKLIQLVDHVKQAGITNLSLSESVKP